MGFIAERYNTIFTLSNLISVSKTLKQQIKPCVRILDRCNASHIVKILYNCISQSRISLCSLSDKSDILRSTGTN